jgi:ankyrin repeat protein
MDALQLDDIDSLRDMKTQCTLMHRAARTGRLKIVKYLYEHKASIEAKDYVNATPLFYAAAGGSLKTSGFLLSKGAHVNIKDHVESSPLMIALRNQNWVELVACFLLFNADINFKVAKGNTPLMLAAREGDFYKVRYLVENGASLVRTNRLQENVLFHAIKFPTIVQYILEQAKLQGSKVVHSLISLQDEIQHNLLHRCIEHGYLASLFHILSSCQSEHDLVTLLNAKDLLKGNTPLHYSVKFCRLEVCKLLTLCKEVDVNKQNNEVRQWKRNMF